MKDFFDNLLHRFGYIPESELILRSLPAEKQKKARSIVMKLNRLETMSNVSGAFDLTQELGAIFREASPEIRTKNVRTKDAVRLIGGDIYGYRPAMARLYSLFQNNPFGIYAFVARHHWAVRTAMQVIRDELWNDGFELRAQKGTSKKRLKEVFQTLKKMDIFELRIDIASHIKLFGNAWILPHKNLLGTPNMLELLAPPKLMPVIDPITDKILGWEYTVGRTTMVYPVDRIFHLWQYTVDNYKRIGDPPLTPAILEIEADLSADSYNNQMFQRGGMMGIIMNVRAGDDPIGRDEEEVVEDLQDRIDSMYSGVKAAQSVLVTNAVEKVYNVNPIGKLDASFMNLHQECAKTVAMCLGVPPEKIAISRSSTLQYIPSLVEDSVNAAFDKALNALTSLVDEFLNDVLLRDMLGITDVRIVSSGRYGALTKNAAETIKTLADSGPIITVNEALERILGWEQLPADNPRGNFVLDNSKNRDPKMLPAQSDPFVEDPNFSKAMTSGEFFSFIDKMRGGQFERKNVTWLSDDTPATRLVYKKGECKFYDDF